MLVLILLKSVVAVRDYTLRGGTEAWRPVVWELTSIVVIAVLAPLVFRGARRLVASSRGWALRGAMLAGGLVAFWLVHVATMVGLRKLVYAVVGTSYVFEGWFYELAKDAVTFGVIACAGIVLGLRERKAPPSLLVQEDKSLVRIEPATIRWVKAEGNYVRVQCDATSHFIRKTLKSFADVEGLVQIHRSILVNAAKVAAVEPLANGDARLRLTSGDELRLSRRYRPLALAAMAKA